MTQQLQKLQLFFYFYCKYKNRRLKSAPRGECQLIIQKHPQLSTDLRVHFSHSICLPVYLSGCLSVCLSVYVTVCLSVWLSICLPVCLSVCPSIWPDQRHWQYSTWFCSPIWQYNYHQWCCPSSKSWPCEVLRHSSAWWRTSLCTWTV